MNKLLKLEEVGQFVLSIFLFNQLEYSWWVFLACILLPDLSMLGYIINTRVGAWLYNIFHHKITGVLMYIIGFYLNNPQTMLSGIILFGHSAIDRIFGYGLKYNDDFKHTHLGWIGQSENK